MAIVFSYTETTDKVVMTGGTSGTPATFADFVTADRAGTAELLAATLCAANMSLTYQIRPVEDLALQISFILAGTSAGAGDTLDITGTDWRGAAQTESINVAAGNGTYTGTNYWRTITDIDCTGWADGTLQVIQPQWGVIWDYENGQYFVDCSFDVGDGSTPTYFATEEEQIRINSNWATFYIKASATFRMGELIGGYRTRKGSMILMRGYAGNPTQAGNLLLYGSLLEATERTNLWTLSGGFTAYNSLLDRIGISLTGGTIDIYNITQSDARWGINFVASATIENVYSRNPDYGFQTAGATPAITIRGGNVDTAATNTFKAYNIVNDYNFIDCESGVWDSVNIANGDGTHYLNRQYSINIHIADKDGANLSGATVLCEDKDGNTIFSVNTDVNGDIAEQDITYQRWWYDGSQQTETLSPHKFTISKTNYETLILDVIIVDGAINWHLELLPALSENDVEDGVSFGESKTGNLEVPSEDDVEDGVGFGSNGTEFEGNFEAPSEDDVEDGVGYGASGAEFEGNLEIPAEEDVELAVTYGANGTEFTGTFIPVYAGQDLIGTLEESVDLEGTLEESVALTGELSP